ncbi:MAG: hypothetical protein Kow0031_33720 [Anaerolineae bacterium]
MTTPIGSKAWFSSGTITFTRSAQTAARTAGEKLTKLLLRHLTGDFGDISDEQAATNQQVIYTTAAIPLHDDIESRYTLANGQELVIITHYVHTPALRWTDICLASQVVSGRPATDGEDERDELDFEPDEDDLDAVAYSDDPSEVAATDAVDELDDDDLALDDLPAEITLDLERILRGIKDTTVILSSLQPGPWRDPDRRIHRAELAALACSIRQDGLINPLLVARERNHYHIIAGEKRWLALCALAVAESGVASLETALHVAAHGGQQMLAKWHYVLREVEVPARLDISQDPQRHQRQFSRQNNVGQARRRWSKAEDEFLLKNLGRMPLAQIGEHLGRTPVAVNLRRRKLQKNNVGQKTHQPCNKPEGEFQIPVLTRQQNNVVGQARRRWSKAEDQFLLKNLGRMPLAQIGEHLGRSAAAVNLRRRRLQIPAPRQQRKSGNAQQRWHNG